MDPTIPLSQIYLYTWFQCIHRFHTDHNAPYLPRPNKIEHNPFVLHFCITGASMRNWKQWLSNIFFFGGGGGWGDKVHYGLGQEPIKFDGLLSR